jgi:hypothetical protein
MMDLHGLRPGDLVRTVDDDNVAEVLAPTEDGAWIRVRYVASDDPGLVGTEDLCAFTELLERVAPLAPRAAQPLGGLKGRALTNRELTDLLIADGVRDGVRPPTDAERADTEAYLGHVRAGTLHTIEEDGSERAIDLAGSDMFVGKGACAECGGDCGEECGIHPAGCIYGGFSSGFWMVAEGCKFDHPEQTFTNDLIDTPAKAAAATDRFMQMYADERCPHCRHVHYGEVTDDGEGRWCDTPLCSEPGCCACACYGQPAPEPHLPSAHDLFHTQLAPRITLRRRARELWYRLRPTGRVLCALGLHGPTYRRWADDPLVSRLETVCRTCRGVQH